MRTELLDNNFLFGRARLQVLKTNKIVNEFLPGIKHLSFGSHIGWEIFRYFMDFTLYCSLTILSSSTKSHRINWKWRYRNYFRSQLSNQQVNITYIWAKIKLTYFSFARTVCPFQWIIRFQQLSNLKKIFVNTQRSSLRF